MGMDMDKGMGMDMDMDMRRIVSLLSKEDQNKMTCSVPLSRFTEIRNFIKLFFEEFQGILQNSMLILTKIQKNEIKKFRRNFVPTEFRGHLTSETRVHNISASSIGATN
jgi:lipid A disaccharide synthetase